MKTIPLIITLFVSILLSACSGGSSDAAAAIEAYQQALVEKDSARLSSLSCADWEAQAQLELESLAAVSVSLEDPTCSVVDAAEDNATVSCTGKLVANYGNEVLEIDLSERDYHAVFEGSEWRMCGYR